MTHPDFHFQGLLCVQPSPTAERLSCFAAFRSAVGPWGGMECSGPSVREIEQELIRAEDPGGCWVAQAIRAAEGCTIAMVAEDSQCMHIALLKLHEAAFILPIYICLYMMNVCISLT